MRMNCGYEKSEAPPISPDLPTGMNFGYEKSITGGRLRGRAPRSRSMQLMNRLIDACI